MANGKNETIKTVIYSVLGTIVAALLLGLISGAWHGCVGGAFDACAADSKSLPKMMDSTAKANDRPMKKILKQIRLSQIRQESFDDATRHLTEEQKNVAEHFFKRKQDSLNLEMEELNNP